MLPPPTDLLQELIPLLSALAFSFGLLWAGAAVADEAHAPGASRVISLDRIALVLLAAGLWWPAHQAGFGGEPVSWTWAGAPWPALTALATAYTARFGAREPWHHTRQWTGTAACAAACAAHVALLHALPGVAPGWHQMSLLAIGLLLAGALRLLLRPRPQRKRPPVAQLAAALVAAAALSAVAWRSGAAAHALADPTLLPTAALLTLGAFLVVTLRQTREQRRRQALTTGTPANSDPLTGLANRSVLEQKLVRAAARCDAERKRIAVLVVNLDGFKPVNATYGHAVGDQLLLQASQRLRRLHGAKDLLARLGADEFVLLLTEQTEREALTGLAQRIVEGLAVPYRLGTRELTLTCSVGMALYPDHGDLDKLITRAEAAANAVKRGGGGGAQLFEQQLDAGLAEDFDLLRDLRKALDGNQFDLAFQPKIDARSGQITAAEALLRWRHPTRGDIPPAVFVALAERFGLVTRLGNWVLEGACKQARAWADAGLNMRVAINLSAQHLRQADLVERIAHLLRRHGVDPKRLTCEITETLAMENTQAAQQTMRGLGELGVHLSIDDFGTGYSSLAYLRRLPASELKIDRSFVLDLERSADARAIVDAVVKLAHALGKRVVAEGVETIRQRRILTELGCDELQGYLFAHPMRADALLQWALEARNNNEEAFRSSLYVDAGQLPRLARAVVASRNEAPASAH